MNQSLCCDVDECVRAIADATRQSILKLLEEREMSVNEINAHFELAQPTVSYHLARLHRANLVAVRREGRQAFYRINSACVADCCEAILSRSISSSVTGPVNTDG